MVTTSKYLPEINELKKEWKDLEESMELATSRQGEIKGKVSRLMKSHLAETKLLDKFEWEESSYGRSVVSYEGPMDEIRDLLEVENYDDYIFSDVANDDGTLLFTMAQVHDNPRSIVIHEWIKSSSILYERFGFTLSNERLKVELIALEKQAAGLRKEIKDIELINATNKPQLERAL